MAGGSKAQAHDDGSFGNWVDISLARIAVAETMLIGGIFLGVALAVTFEYSPSDWPYLACTVGLILFAHFFLLWPAYRWARARKAARRRS